MFEVLLSPVNLVLVYPCVVLQRVLKLLLLLIWHLVTRVLFITFSILILVLVLRVLLVLGVRVDRLLPLISCGPFRNVLLMSCSILIIILDSAICPRFLIW
jgi:hypothetical protein